MIDKVLADAIMDASKKWFERSSLVKNYGVDKVSFRMKNLVVSITIKKGLQKLTLIFQPTIAGADLCILFKTATGKVKFYDIWYRGEDGQITPTAQDLSPYLMAFWRAFTHSR